MQKNRSLKVLRAKHGLTQEAIAKQLNISRQYYAAIENGETAGNIQFWAKLQKALSVPSEEMWGLINNEEPAQV